MTPHELEAVVDAARRAGARVSELFAAHRRAGIEVREKGPGDPVTRADLEANALLCEALAEALPDAAIVSEESLPEDAGTLARLISSGRVLFVDPLDGTSEFVAGRPEFAVMVGLAIDGAAAAGVLVIPEEDRTLAGVRGQGAWCERGAQGRRPLAVSKARAFDEARMLVSRSHTPPLVEPLRRRLGVSRLVPCGSAGVKAARVAAAEAEIYAHDGPAMKLWDVCAADALIHAAGGRMTDLEGHPIDYATTDLELRHGVLATNEVLHAGVLSAVEWARRELARTEG